MISNHKCSLLKYLKRRIEIKLKFIEIKLKKKNLFVLLF